MSKNTEKLMLKTSDIQFDPANARTHSRRNLDAIKGSLARWGQQKPIVVTKDNVVLAGNGTLAAIKELGWEQVWVNKSELTDFEAAAYALADNRTSELAAWNDEILEKTLEELKNAKFPIEDIGFEDIAWESDIPDLDKIDANLDGIIATIKITCPQAMKGEVIMFLKERIAESGFEGVEVE